MKNPANLGRSSGAGEAVQIELFERPVFSPTLPKRATKAARTLTLLLNGQKITHHDFIESGDGWRLAAYVHELKEIMGWPIDKVDVPAPTANCPWRTIARYFLPQWVIDEFGEAE